MIVFITSLRHPLRSNDYGRVEALLKATLDSVGSQTVPQFHTIVVGHVEPSFALPANATFVKVGFQPPRLRDGAVSRESVRQDKGKKLAIAARWAKDYNPEYIAILDADDFVSNRLVEFILDQPRGGGWIIKDGYKYSAQTGTIVAVKNFHKKCGTCLVYSAEELDIPDCSIYDHKKILDLTGKKYYRDIYGSHIRSESIFSAAGRPLRRLPFPGATYLVDTGENHSLSTLSAGAVKSYETFNVSPEILDEFRLPPPLMKP